METEVRQLIFTNSNLIVFVDHRIAMIQILHSQLLKLYSDSTIYFPRIKGEAIIVNVCAFLWQDFVRCTFLIALKRSLQQLY